MAIKKKSSRSKNCPYPQEFIDELRGKLEAERQRIVARLQQSHSNLKNNNANENVEETGSEDFVHAADLSIMGVDSNHLNMIDSALAKIEKGTYGVCEDCGGTIPEARMRARPFAHYCIACKTIREDRGEFGAN